MRETMKKKKKEKLKYRKKTNQKLCNKAVSRIQESYSHSLVVLAQ